MAATKPNFTQKFVVSSAEVMSGFRRIEMSINIDARTMPMALATPNRLFWEITGSTLTPVANIEIRSVVFMVFLNRFGKCLQAAMYANLDGGLRHSSQSHCLLN